MSKSMADWMNENNANCLFADLQVHALEGNPDDFPRLAMISIRQWTDERRTPDPKVDMGPCCESCRMALGEQHAWNCKMYRGKVCTTTPPDPSREAKEAVIEAVMNTRIYFLRLLVQPMSTDYIGVAQRHQDKINEACARLAALGQEKKI